MTNNQSIIATLIYADIFDYPLEAKQIFNFLITYKCSFKSTNDSLSILVKQGQVGQLGTYYFLPGREKIVNLRKKREKWAIEKLTKAKKAVNVLKIIPQIKLVGISGGLAMSNTDIDDDVDLFIISANNQIWTTRFLASSTLSMLGQRRSFNSKNNKNKICLNMFMDESDLEIKPYDLYLAHEIVQMIPIWDRDSTYQKFINANLWISKYLPNWKADDNHNIQIKSLNFNVPALFFIEKLFYKFQLSYMSKKRTTEKITAKKIQFHPADAHNRTLSIYKERLEKFKIN